MNTKKCKKCKIKQDKKLFKKSLRRIDGCGDICKNCRDEKIINDRKTRYKRDIINYPLRRQFIERRFVEWKCGCNRRNKRRIKNGKLGFSWNISIEDVKSLPLVCYYTGIELTMENYKFNTVSLDRINSEIGYEKGNICFCCSIINEMKSDTNVNYFVSLCEKVAANKNKILTNLPLKNS